MTNLSLKATLLALLIASPVFGAPAADVQVLQRRQPSPPPPR